MCEVEFAFAQNKKDFTSTNIQHILGTLLKQNFSYKVEESEMDLALGALQASIDSLGLLQNEEASHKQFTLKRYTLGQYLRLDVAALKALNVFPVQNVESAVSGQAGSIFGLLNQCKTQIGARLLKKWLKQPTTNKEEIQMRLDIVEFLF